MPMSSITIFHLAGAVCAHCSTAFTYPVRASKKYCFSQPFKANLGGGADVLKAGALLQPSPRYRKGKIPTNCGLARCLYFRLCMALRHFISILAAILYYHLGLQKTHHAHAWANMVVSINRVIPTYTRKYANPQYREPQDSTP